MQLEESPEWGTMGWALQYLPPDIAADFDCIRGPHRWAAGLAGRFDFCLDCPKVRRIPWPDTAHLAVRVPS